MMRKYLMVSLVLVAMSAILFGCNDSTTAPVINEDPAPIAAPANINARVTADGVLITWDPSSHPELRGYNVYRYDRNAGEIVQLNATVVLETRYLDHSAHRQVQYQYRVTSVSRRSESSYTGVDIELRKNSEGETRDREDTKL